MAFSRKYIGKGKQVENRNIVEVSLNMAEFQNHSFEYEGETYVKFNVVKPKEIVHYGVYHDIDVDWLLKQRRRNLFDSNQLSSSELINRLMLMGNERAEFMISKQPGMRSNGMRHPHSWSIVDEIECIQWILKLLD